MKHLAIITICFAFAVPSTRNQSTSHQPRPFGQDTLCLKSSGEQPLQMLKRVWDSASQICGRSKHDAITKQGGASKSKTCWAKQPGLQPVDRWKTSGGVPSLGWFWDFACRNYIKSNYIMDIHYTISTGPGFCLSTLSRPGSNSGDGFFTLPSLRLLHPA